MRHRASKTSFPLSLVDPDRLAFVEFSFEDLEAERIENLFLDRALQRPRAVNRIVAFARDQCLGGIGQLERDLLLLETFRQAAQLDLDDLLQVLLVQPVEDDDLVDAIQKLRPEMLRATLPSPAATGLRSTLPR